MTVADMNCPHESRLSHACGSAPLRQPAATMPSGHRRTDLVYLLSDTAQARGLARTMQDAGVAAGVRSTRGGHALSVSHDDLIRVGSEALLPQVPQLAMAG